MKKMFIVMIVVAMAAACGGKKAAPAKPAGGSDMKPAGEGSGEMKGSGETKEAPPPSM
jgi:hypothetical protein